MSYFNILLLRLYCSFDVDLKGSLYFKVASISKVFVLNYPSLIFYLLKFHLL